MFYFSNSAGESSDPEVAYRVKDLTYSPPNSHDKILVRGTNIYLALIHHSA